MLSISQIDQKVDTEWPLTVIDHNGNKDESAKVIHGRQFHLDGDYFDNEIMQNIKLFLKKFGSKENKYQLRYCCNTV